MLCMQGGGDDVRNSCKPLSRTLCPGRGHVFMGSADGDTSIGVPGASGMAKAAQLGHSGRNEGWGGGQL